MAENALPVPAGVDLPAAGGLGGARLPGADFVSGFTRLPILRQVGLMLGLAASVALGFSVVLWMQAPDMRPLTDARTADTPAITALLDEARIPWKLDETTGSVLVEAADIHPARLAIAGSDLIDKGQGGFEGLSEDSGFGTSQFMENARFVRALEGELARTIGTLTAIRAARVHLAIPRTTSFLRDTRKPSASVTVTLGGGRALDEGQVRAIVNLVAAAVPELDGEDVAVVDQNGRLLSGGDHAEGQALTEWQFDYTRRVEEDLLRKIGNILAPTVGHDRFSAEVSAELDFAVTQSTEESFNPALPALRSEETLLERQSGAGAVGVPGALSNVPPAVGTIPQELNGGNADPTAAPAGGGEAAAPTPTAGSGREREQATRNFELDRQISHTTQARGRVQRLSISIVVDDLPVIDPETGEEAWAPWPQEELDRMALLVRNAVGYDEGRGDVVTVVNAPFRVEPEAVVPELPLWQQTWFIDLVKQGLGGLLLAVLVFGVLRPAFRTLVVAGHPDADENADLFSGALTGFDETRLEHALDDVVSLGRHANPLLPGASAGYGNQLEAVRALVAEDPARVAQVLKHWISSDE